MKRKPADLTLRETLRWEPQTGFQRIDQHIRRLLRSADALGFRAPANAVQALEKAVGGDKPLCVRLVMNYKGELDIETTEFEPLRQDTVWRVRIARNVTLDSTDTFYRHKSSRREPYDAARAEFSAGEADEVLLLNERGELCEGTITNVFADFGDGILATPRLDCGLLPGVLRAELLDGRKAEEAVFSFGDLRSARSVFVGNSLRGLIPASLD